ncbi:MAG: glycoside hydrolase family 105 protein [Lachnospiraceae bacterium]
MSDLIWKDHSALDYACMACDTLMKKFAPEDLPPKGRFHYHQGVFLSGMQKVYDICGDEKYFNYIKDWVNSIIWEDGSIHNYDKGQLDDIQPGILLYELYEKTQDERYKKALFELLPIIKNFPRNDEGGLWHKHIHPQQMWLDGIYMAGPISTKFASVFHQPEYFDLAAFQALLMVKKTKDTKTGLLYHAWDRDKTMPWANKETGLSPEFWGRSIGWVPVAVLEELDDLPLDHKDRDRLICLVTDLIKALILFQDNESGLWYQVVDKGGKEGNWLESSCTCLFVASICKAVKDGFLGEEYLVYAQKGYEGIINRLKYNENGVMIDNICVGTGVGDYKHYCNRPTCENDLHGAGAFILMCTEVYKAFHK